MILAEFFKEYNSLFDAQITYPETYTGTLLTDIDNDMKREYALRVMRHSFDKLADLYEEDYDDYVRNVVLALLVRNEYKYKTLLATEDFEYDPIENYNMIETLTNDITTDAYGKIDTLQHGQSQTRTPNLTDTRTPNLTDTRTPNTTDTHTPTSLTTTETDQIEGFNSSSWQDANKKTIVQSGSEATTHTGTETVAQTGTETVAQTGTETVANTGSDIDTLSGQDTHTRNYTLTRSGNIGVTTSQQMIEAERNVANFSALQVICADLALELTYGVF